MKRLALLLAAMGIVSAAAMAEAPVLKVTNVGQYLEIENTSGGSDIGEDTYLGNTVGLSYGDWSIGLEATKFWNADTDAIKSKDARAQITVSRPVAEGLVLGARVRMQDAYDKYYGFYNYANGGFYSEGWFWYTSNNEAKGDPDMIGIEAWPLKYTYGDFGVAWYVTGETNMESTRETKMESYMRHEARLYWNFYQGEKLSLNTEYRVVVSDTKDYDGGDKAAKIDVANTVSTDFGTHTLYLNANYAVTESFSVFGTYGYKVSDLEYVNNGKECKDKNYYGDFIVGWNYKF